MLSVKMIISPGEAGGYYAQDDYYLESKGYWCGNGEMLHVLGLSGEVNKEDFTKLLWGYHPKSGQPPIGIVKNAGYENRRGGSDFTFSAPKSVSLLSFKDKRIQGAFDAAVRRSLDYFLPFVQTRHKNNGVVSVEKTGKTVFSVFNHATARPPEEDVTPDPQLHAHCLMHNLTIDAEGRFMCIHNPFSPERIHLLGQYFRNELAREIQKLEYQIEITDKSEGFFKIKGVPDEIEKDFSSRSEQIKKRVEEQRKLRFKDIKDEKTLKNWAIDRVGTTDPAIVQAEIEKLRKSDEFVYAKQRKAKVSLSANKETRKHKNKDIRESDVIEKINEVLATHGETLDDLTMKAKEAGLAPPPTVKDATEAILNAVEEATKTEVAFTREAILNKAMKLTIGGNITPETLSKTYDRLIEADNPKIAPLLIKATKWGEAAYYSTPELMEVERQNVETCLKSKTNIVVDGRIVDEFVDQTQKRLIAENPDGLGFTPGQIDALRHILTTDSQYSVIQGYAGTGKSFSMRYAKELLERQGYDVLGVAPTGKATDELTNAAEIKTTMTIDSLISTKNKPLEHGKKYCIVVDESSMGESRTINELLKITQEYGAKVIFVGDKDQFLPVGAGKFFADLQKTGIKTTVMKDVIRQKTPQTKSIVKALAAKEIPTAINTLTGYAAVAGYDKTNVKKYKIGQKISFHDYDRTTNILPGTTALVTAVGNTELTIEYTIRGQKITTNIDPQKTHKNYTLYEENKGYKNCIHTIEDKNARQQAVANDYVHCYKNGTDALVITATNEDRRSLNKIIRDALVGEGKVKNIGDFPLLEPVNVKPFIFADAFKIGQQVKGLPQLKIDNEYGFGEIINVEPNQNRLTIRNPKTDEEFKIDPSDYVKKQFSVFDKNTSMLGIGEKITFLKNARVTDEKTGKTVNLRNGQLATITGLDKEGNISVKVDKKDVTFNLKDYNYLTTAFALSLHKSQGMTVDKVIWHADTQKDVSMNSFYVAITRCKRDVAVYTDDIDALQKKASEEQDKFSTIDDEFDEIYEKTYKKYREKHKQEAEQPAPTVDIAKPEAAPPPPPAPLIPEPDIVPATASTAPTAAHPVQTPAPSTPATAKTSPPETASATHPVQTPAQSIIEPVTTTVATTSTVQATKPQQSMMPDTVPTDVHPVQVPAPSKPVTAAKAPSPETATTAHPVQAPAQSIPEPVTATTSIAQATKLQQSMSAPDTAPTATHPVQTSAQSTPEPVKSPKPAETVEDKLRQRIIKEVRNSKLIGKLQYEKTPWMKKNDRWLFSGTVDNTKKEIEKNYTIICRKEERITLDENVAVLRNTTKKCAEIAIFAIEDNELFYAIYKPNPDNDKELVPVDNRLYHTFDEAAQAAKYAIIDKVYEQLDKKAKAYDNDGPSLL